ncbi:pentapeptide repeat-containing protein [Oceanospirillum sediminis]|uniref:Pentapeptide repeat-containing protein n=1 Tax=Oceanospirillum sediminis TaxID=2760088 RepID=A0A839ITV8_9GAMM|nr:pentapeptide repeat-containing protein [Oceanospirillum sediminis]MBB1488074.1 pentapeptide repeat-containing protein [Oceanospirillum sediminis]
MSAPKILQDPLYQLLRDENIQGFNEARAQGISTDLRCGDFRGLDLRGLNADGLDMSNAYFRGSDLRGIDFTHCRLEGSSIAGANISGCYFPKELSADELLLSMNHGIRMRYNS